MVPCVHCDPPLGGKHVRIEDRFVGELSSVRWRSDASPPFVHAILTPLGVGIVNIPTVFVAMKMKQIGAHDVELRVKGPR